MIPRGRNPHRTGPHRKILGSHSVDIDLFVPPDSKPKKKQRTHTHTQKKEEKEEESLCWFLNLFGHYDRLKQVVVNRVITTRSGPASALGDAAQELHRLTLTRTRSQYILQHTPQTGAGRASIFKPTDNGHGPGRPVPISSRLSVSSQWLTLQRYSHRRRPSHTFGSRGGGNDVNQQHGVVSSSSLFSSWLWRGQRE